MFLLVAYLGHGIGRRVTFSDYLKARLRKCEVNLYCSPIPVKQIIYRSNYVYLYYRRTARHKSVYGLELRVDFGQPHSRPRRVTDRNQTQTRAFWPADSSHRGSA